jgi:tocopherol O-methyltransferase
MATAAQIAEHYDSLAFIYRNFWGDHIHHGLFFTGDESPQQAQERMVDECAHKLGPFVHARVLDVGCGHGGTLVRLVKLHGASQAVGLTLSAKQAKLARENAQKAGLAEQITAVHQDVETYEFPAASFDLVWTMESSEHFQDKPAYFRNVAKTLRPGGKLLLAAWTGSMQSPPVREVAQRFLCPAIQTADDYAVQIEAAGMTLQSREELRDSVVRTWEICQEYAGNAGPMLSLLPRAAREFVAGIPVILDAYRSGDLGYTVLTAQKPGQSL